MKSVDSFGTKKTIQVGTQAFSYYSLRSLEQSIGVPLNRIPFSLRILLENLLRREDGITVRKEDIVSLARWDAKAKPEKEISFMPARVLLQDFTGVPCMVDLAVMRDAIIQLGGDPKKINPLQPVDLVIDHSVQVDDFGSPDSFRKNAALEFERNRERYAFLRWGQQAFSNFRVVPPDTGIVHQINLEYLARVVFTAPDEDTLLVYPDTLVGTDSHTTMINGLGVLGWGVGGIEAEAAMLGQPISLLVPNVVGVRLLGRLRAGSTATDLVLTLTQMLRKKGVVGKFIEFFGPGLSSLSAADRATLANMAPEYGATMGFFPVDMETLNYLRSTGRTQESVGLIEAYLKEQGLFHTAETPEPEFSEIFELNLAAIEPSIAGPKRPQDRIPLSKSKSSFRSSLVETLESAGIAIDKMAAATWAYYSDDSIKPTYLKNIAVESNGRQFTLQHGSVVIAAITSCTNTSNPALLISAGILAKKAIEKGLTSKPWVKTSLAPGSKVTTEYLRSAQLLQPLETLGFHLVGYGCTTCIGNSGPLAREIADAIQENNLVTAAVLSGNRNFEGRVHPLTKMNFLASPQLVVAYAIAGTMDIDFSREPLGIGSNGEPVFLKDIWPSLPDILHVMRLHVKPELFKKEYADVFTGDENWKNCSIPTGDQYQWEDHSTYIKAAPYFNNFTEEPKPLEDIQGARVLALLGDSVTTDHISPAGSFREQTPAGEYLSSLGVLKKDFNQYGARRGNHEIMVRGTFANIRLKNLLVPDKEGGVTLHPSSNEAMTIFDAAMKYKETGTPLLIIAGKEYGSGSSRDWAAKGPALLGVRAVIAESFERIHRSNLIGMGILPLQFEAGQNAGTIGLTGFETYTIEGIAENLKPGKKINITAVANDGWTHSFSVLCRIDTPNEVEYYSHNGILPYVLRSLIKPAMPAAEIPKKADSTVQRKPGIEPPRKIAVEPAKKIDIEAAKKTVLEAKVQKYRILFNGEIDPGQDIQEVKGRLAQLFKTTPLQIEKLFAGSPVTININLEYAAAQEYINQMKKAGALCYFEPMKAPPVFAPASPQKKVPIAGSKPIGAGPGRPKGGLSAKGQAPVYDSPLYTAGWIATAAAMFALLFFYGFSILYIAIRTLDHITENGYLLDGDSILMGIIWYFLPILVGIVLTASMLKPIIARPIAKRFSIGLSKKKEQMLYTFIEKLCRSIGAKTPSSVEIDCSAAVSANYRRGVIGFLEDDLILTLGVPAIGELSTTELSSLLAHEFAHHSDKLNTRLYYIITGVRDWFYRRIYEEDTLDDRIHMLVMTAGGFLRVVVLPLIEACIWLSRQILRIFLFLGNLISRFYVRQMEFSADRIAVRFSNPEAFESSLHKTQGLDLALRESISQLKIQKKPMDNSLPNDFILLVSSVFQRASQKDNSKVKENALRNLKGVPEKNPTDRERIERAKTLPSSASDQPETAASALFSFFEETSKLLSQRFYREVLNFQFSPESLIPTAEFIGPEEKEPETPESPDTPDIPLISDSENNFF